MTVRRPSGARDDGELALTAAARGAMHVPMSRRALLKGSGALVVSFSAAGLANRLGMSPPVASAQGPRETAEQLDSWIAVAADGRVTAYTGKCELGQGLYTAQTQLIAEELSVPVTRVTLVQCDTAVTPDQGTTSGSQSHPANFNRRNLALAAATARGELLRLASDRLGTPVSQLGVREGIVRVRTDPTRGIGYGELVAGGRFNITLDRDAVRKDPRGWTVLGTSVPRLDLPALATGELEFVHNVQIPGMLHGRVVRPPAVGARLVRVDESSVRDVPGLVRVVVRSDFVGIVAEKPWAAAQAAGRLAVEWTPGVGLPDQRDFYEYLRRQQPTRDTVLVDSGDIDERLGTAATVLTATYTHPYQMHGSVGTSCAVADVRDDRATIWSATQAVYPLRSTAATILGLSPANVHVMFARGAGCYGINGADTVSYDAALLSQAVGRPVRVQLSRQDEMAWENYGSAFVIDQRAGVDADGTIVAWDYEAWSARLGSRPGSQTPGNVITGFLVGFQPAAFSPRAPAPAPTGAFRNRSNAAPSYVAGCVAGTCGGTGIVGGERVLSHSVRSPFWTGPLRSPARLQNTFAHESFMDELAARVGADPVQFRLRHVRDPRLIEVVSAATQAANWDTRPSPKPDLRGRGIATGRGIACVLYEGDNGYCALVAEVEVDQDTGAVVVRRFVVGHDCGPISNPDGLRNQIEGGALQGMSRALTEEVTWNDQRVTSVDWPTYGTLGMGLDVPEIESVLINRLDVRASGAGETVITVVAAAIGNAIFDATGARLRQVPFSPERVKAAITTRFAR